LSYLTFFLFQVQALVADKEELVKDLKRLNNKLDSALSDCNAKNELANKQTKVAQEAMAGSIFNICVYSFSLH